MNEQQNTKILRVVEAVEALGVASWAACHAGERTRDAAEKDVVDCRVELACSLKEFLLPVLRVIDGGPQQSENVVVCRTCHDKVPCKPTCAAWAASIQHEIGQESLMTLDDNGTEG